ncbi:hypothetical protein J2128_000183 [Methanomicrobium sp. W14]|uniref:hypothetical protein n=1 Tax=Methanomicrobium sp. W14 TaxID=2817839 RepID=UPI001AEB915B|nr:hypothetical protein [Methanomicrobium sp. W14]MBP2132262.1 hypothetical protein [Methanomicrobium sp. W14]
MAGKSIDYAKGKNLEEKLEKIGAVKGKECNVLDLNRLSKKYDLEVVLYFEKELAENSTYEKDLADFAGDDEFGRPFIAASRFLEFGKENDPTFEQRLKEFPLMIKIIDYGEITSEEGSKKIYVKGLMPFLDEFDVDKEPGPFIGDVS